MKGSILADDVFINCAVANQHEIDWSMVPGNRKKVSEEQGGLEWVEGV